MLSIKFIGGIGYSYSGQVVIHELPDQLQVEVRRLLDTERLGSLIKSGARRDYPDAISCQIQWANQPVIQFSEAEVDAETLELIDALRPYMKIKASVTNPSAD